MKEKNLAKKTGRKKNLVQKNMNHKKVKQKKNLGIKN